MNRPTQTGRKRNQADPGPPVKGSNPADLRFRFPVAGSRGIITGAAGTQASSVSVFPSGNVPNWASLQGEFDEYRVLSAHVTYSSIGASNGVAALWVDETDATVPVANDANQRPHKLMKLSGGEGYDVHTPGSQKISWVAQDYLDLQFSPMSAASPTPAFFKFYSDTANYGGSATGTAYYELWYDIEFRGIGGDA